MMYADKEKPRNTFVFVLPLLLFFSLGQVHAQVSSVAQVRQPILVSVRENLDRLLAEEDTDDDQKITVDDTFVKGKGRGDKRFWLIAINGKRYEVVGTYHLSNLLQQLKLAEDAGFEVAQIDFEKIFESPVQRTSRSIREIYWDGLTRTLDGNSLCPTLRDEKIDTGPRRYLYVPHTDPEAFKYFKSFEGFPCKARGHFPAFRIKVERLQAITPEYVRRLDGKHGALSLALKRVFEVGYVGVPFVVPGGRFNEMYGWDSYFEALGLLVDDRVDLAEAMVDNFVYQITHYGKILNANRSYYLTRSQPPFLTSMALAVYKRLPKTPESKAWLKRAFHAAIKEYYTVWMDGNHLTPTGLSRYYGSGIGASPEVEKGHFDAIYKPHADRRDMDVRTFEKKYKAGEITNRELDQFFIHDRCVRESGHDTTYRWDWTGDRCADFVTVDLNSLLYKIELDIAQTIEKEFDGSLKMPQGAEEKSSKWRDRAKKRKALMIQYLWDEKHGMFFDYDFNKNKKHHVYVSATTFYPLWAGLATKEQAELVVGSALPLLEMPGGVAVSTEKSRGPISTIRPERQWDYPNGWAPHQMLIWQGLINYGYDEIAHRLIYRWLYTITRNAVDYNGTIPEKLDVVKRSHEVFAEYGNVGTKFAYITKEGFGWVNASYQVGLKLLPPDLRSYLDRLFPPEWLFER
jgi:alpha,alpha-trehalase